MVMSLAENDLRETLAPLAVVHPLTVETGSPHAELENVVHLITAQTSCSYRTEAKYKQCSC